MVDQPTGSTSDSGADDAFARLQANDPAVERGVDANAIRLSVAERLGEQAPDELTSRRHTTATPRHRSLWIAVAASGCALALVGGIGFVAGRSSGGGQVVATEAFRLNAANGAANSGAMPGAPMGGPAMGVPEVAASGGAPVASTDSKMMAPYFNGRVVYRAASGLQGGAGSAQAYAYDATAIDGKKAAATLADALGIAGNPVDMNGVWAVGPQDGSGATVSVTSDGMRSFYSYDPRYAPQPCAVSVPAETSGAVAGSSGSGGGSAVEVKPGECPTSTGKPAPQGEDAIAPAKKLMKAIGVDPAGFEWQVVDSGDPTNAYVTAAQVVDGQQTGSMWGFGIVAGGKVANASGMLAPLVPLGAYDTVPATVAVDRLGDPRFGGGYYGGPIAYASDVRGSVAAEGSAVSSDAVSAPTPVIPTPMKPGASFDWPVTTVTITKAKLGLAQYFEPDGATVLIPTYQLTGDDESVSTVVAVVDSALAMG